MSVNLVFVSGYVGRDPTQYSEAATNINLGISEDYKKDGQWIKKTTWIKVVCFGPLAKKAMEKVRKGDYITVEGKLQTSHYEKDGQTIYETKIIARSLPDCHIKRFKESKAKTEEQDEFDMAMDAPAFDPNEPLPF